MKHIRYIITSFLAASALVSAVSCSDVLDIQSPTQYQEGTIWESGKENLDMYITGHYGTLRDESQLRSPNSKYTDALTDIIKSGDWNNAQRYNRIMSQESEIKPEGGWLLDNWSGCYDRIKRDNEFFNDLKKYENDYDAEWLKPRVAEMRFIRAYSYFLLIRMYGGVVIRDELDGPEQNDKSRSTEEKSWQFVIDEMSKAAEDLPLTWPAEWHGRLTKAACYGFLSRVGVYARNWDVAEKAADKCKETGGKLDPKFSNVFNSIWSPENLISIEFFQRKVAASLCHQADLFFRPKGDDLTHPGSAKINAWLVPTSEYVDAFEMKDGSEFSWSTHGSNPYKDRDSRFYASILYNGAPWEGRTIETFETGMDGIQKFSHAESASSTVTGYYLKKFVTENDHSWDLEGSNHFDILLRYAEVLLNKAEALVYKNDLNGALVALNEVRTRAGQPAKTLTDVDAVNEDKVKGSEYGPKKGELDARQKKMMCLIEKERVVELGGEGFRYWDLRRWRRSMDVLNGTNAHGCWITKQGDHFDYRQINVDGTDKRIFKEKYYAFSIPLAERTKNKLFGENNPGW